MLHSYPLRRPRMLPLFACVAAVFALSLVLTLFYACYAPNWDVPLYGAVIATVLLLLVLLLLRSTFGQRSLQIEHAGVVVTDYLCGTRLRRRVFQAVQVRHFDWEKDTADGGWTLRLLIQRHPAAHPSFLSVLSTNNPYLLAAAWRDLELHYPGSGLCEAPPAAEESSARPSRIVGSLLVLSGILFGAGVWNTVSRPLYLCACGQVTPAVVQRIVWDSPRPGSTYHLLCLPSGNDTPRMGITAYEQTPYIPQVGSPCEILWAPQSKYCCSPAAVVPFLLPLPLLSFALIPLICGLWSLLPVRKKL